MFIAATSTFLCFFPPVVVVSVRCLTDMLFQVTSDLHEAVALEVHASKVRNFRDKARRIDAKLSSMAMSDGGMHGVHGADGAHAAGGQDQREPLPSPPLERGRNLRVDAHVAPAVAVAVGASPKAFRDSSAFGRRPRRGRSPLVPSGRAASQDWDASPDVSNGRGGGGGGGGGGDGMANDPQDLEDVAVARRLVYDLEVEMGLHDEPPPAVEPPRHSRSRQTRPRHTTPVAGGPSRRTGGRLPKSDRVAAVYGNGRAGLPAGAGDPPRARYRVSRTTNRPAAKSTYARTSRPRRGAGSGAGGTVGVQRRGGERGAASTRHAPANAARLARNRHAAAMLGSSSATSHDPRRTSHRARTGAVNQAALQAVKAVYSPEDAPR